MASRLDRKHRRERTAAAVRIDPVVVDALANPAPIASAADPRARARRDITRELDRQMFRAIWRAERRGRGLPRDVRQGAKWIHSQRRTIAHELTRALRALGAGPELSRQVAAQACKQFPRDGVILPDTTATPRAQGTAPRQRGINPRAQGESPRQRGVSPRQRRAAAELHGVETIAHAAHATRDRAADPHADPRALQLEAMHAPPPAPPGVAPPPSWAAAKQQVLDAMTPDERLRARKAAQDELERLEQLNRRSDRTSPPTERRS